MPDVLRYSAVQNKMHAAQKPLELLCDLMSRSLLPGQTVLDPCAGSGSIFPAANMRKVIATGIEQVMINYLMAKERMNGTE
jgi:DNA modification methylase